MFDEWLVGRGGRPPADMSELFAALVQIAEHDIVPGLAAVLDPWLQLAGLMPLHLLVQLPPNQQMPNPPGPPGWKNMLTLAIRLHLTDDDDPDALAAMAAVELQQRRARGTSASRVWGHAVGPCFAGSITC